MGEFDWMMDEYFEEEESSLDWGENYSCPNCGSSFDGHYCNNCGYVEQYY